MFENKEIHFDQISLLITVYNRSDSLIRLLKSFQELKISFYEIVVSDDGSEGRHLDNLHRLKHEYGFKLITTPYNKGLGNNINKGQDAVTGLYTLYVQEDFIPLDSMREELVQSTEILNINSEVDIIHYYSYFPYPYSRPYNDDYSEKVFNLSLFDWNHLKFYLYGDHPHIRRSDFLEKFGRYDEGIKSDVAEYNMSLSFINHNAKALFHNKYDQLFEQRNSLEEPSTISRNDWKYNQNLFMHGLRRLYLVFRLMKGSVQVTALRIKKTVKMDSISFFKNPKWLEQFSYDFERFEEIPPDIFNSINRELDRIQGIDPLVTVLISAWNEEINILRCIASLAKTKFNHAIEIIVVNNNSMDKTQYTIDQLHVKGLFEKRQGCGPARQHGQELAKGKYILLADADCLYPPYWVEDMINILQKPNTVCIYGRYSFISKKGFPRWKLVVFEKMKDIITEFRHINRPYFNAYGISMGYVKELGLKVGFIMTKFWGDDGQLCLGLMEYGKVRQVKSNRARPWTGVRSLERNGNFIQACIFRLKKELKRFFKNFDSSVPERHL